VTGASPSIARCGYRSSIATSILHRYGITQLIEMAGGLAVWDAAQLPVVSQA
jgi:hydroxyacylglutathione hydrolase